MGLLCHVQMDAVWQVLINAGHYIRAQMESDAVMEAAGIIA